MNQHLIKQSGLDQIRRASINEASSSSAASLNESGFKSGKAHAEILVQSLDSGSLHKSGLDGSQVSMKYAERQARKRN